MRLLGFGEGIALCVFIAVQQFCVGEEVLFDVNWCFSSTTIVSPHKRSISIGGSKFTYWQPAAPLFGVVQVNSDARSDGKVVLVRLGK